jgi:hypothetical protein
MSGWLVAIDGASAAGKTRTVRTAARSEGVVAIAEAYERLQPRPALTWRTEAELLRLERRLLREEARRFEEGRRRAAAGATVWMDTGCLGPLTYTAGLVRLGHVRPAVFAEVLQFAAQLTAEGRWAVPDAVVLLRTERGERERRARRDPVGHPRTLQPRHQSVADEELHLYRTVIGPSLGGRFHFVSGGGAPGEVVARILRLPRRAHRSRSWARTLRALGRARGVS